MPSIGEGSTLGPPRATTPRAFAAAAPSLPFFSSRHARAFGVERRTRARGALGARDDRIPPRDFEISCRRPRTQTNQQGGRGRVVFRRLLSCGVARERRDGRVHVARRRTRRRGALAEEAASAPAEISPFAGVVDVTVLGIVGLLAVQGNKKAEEAKAAGAGKGAKGKKKR